MPAEGNGPLCPVCAEAVPAAVERCPRCQADIRLHGRYVLERLLGSGGQGRTFAARDLEGGTEERASGRLAFFHEGPHPYRVEIDLDPQ